MAVRAETVLIQWKPDVEGLAERLQVRPEEADAFARTARAAGKAFAPRTWTLDVALEAVGEDFALLGGEWLDGARVAGWLSKASRIWAFAVAVGEAPQGADAKEAWWMKALGERAVLHGVDELSARLPRGAGEHMNVLVPGYLSDFPEGYTAAVARMLKGNAGVSATPEGKLAPALSMVGLMFSAPGLRCGQGGRGKDHCAGCNKCLP